MRVILYLLELPPWRSWWTHPDWLNPGTGRYSCVWVSCAERSLHEEAENTWVIRRIKLCFRNYFKLSGMMSVSVVQKKYCEETQIRSPKMNIICYLILEKLQCLKCLWYQGKSLFDFILKFHFWLEITFFYSKKDICSLGGLFFACLIFLF